MSVKPQSLMKVGAFFIHTHSKEIFMMQHRWHIALFSTLFFSASVHGAELDTTQTYRADEVVITATRSSIQTADSPSPVKVLTTQDISRTNGSSVADVLRSSESIFLKDYGPLVSLKTISFRGMAAEHILVLLDGTRINNFQNGQVDFSLFPMNNIERIEIVRGGNSALYGADALGGIINIMSRRPTDAVQVHADASIGSFDYRKYSLETRGRVQNLGLVLGVLHDHATGNYPYIFHRIGYPDTTQKRDGADFTRTQIYINSDYAIDHLSSIALSLQRVKSNQGAPGSLQYTSALRQDDDALTGVAAIHDNHLNGLTVDFNFGLTYDLQKYYSQTKTTLLSMNPQVQWIVNPWDRLIVGGEFVEGHLEGMLPEIVIKRIQRSVFVSNEMLFQRESTILDRLSLYQSIRYDVLSEGEDAFSPKIGFNLRLLHKWDTRLRSSYSRNFRMPTFNDLYDTWLGNPELKPEHSESFDFGIETAFDHAGAQTFQLTYFNIETRNRILPNSFYFPVNVHQAQSQGVEGRYDVCLPGDGLTFFADITLNKAIRRTGADSIDPADGKQLLYIPKFVGAFGVSIQIYDILFNLTHTMTSQRFIKEDESASLPRYSLTDINLSTSIRFQLVHLNLRTEISNIFNNNYQVLPDYPMPGRSFRMTIGLDI
jgi:vitamin B12 transporter